jgi:hypothetical protein
VQKRKTDTHGGAVEEPVLKCSGMESPETLSVQPGLIPEYSYELQSLIFQFMKHTGDKLCKEEEESNSLFNLLKR